MKKTYPDLANVNISEKNPQTQIYGHRLYKDQTLYEYLLEFLVVFISKKGDSQYSEADDGFSFFVPKDDKQLIYFPNPRMGLKRFIFFNRSEQEKRFKIDKEAIVAHRDHLATLLQIENKHLQEDFVLDVIQDLFYGFNAITGKRSWFAQSSLPLAPEMIFCEAIGNKKTRTDSSNFEEENGGKWVQADKKFNFDQHAFMARGGEVYYLHVTQGLQDAKPEIKESLTKGLKDMVTSIPQLSQISSFIQGQWEEVVNNENEEDLNFHYVKKKAEFIPSEYAKRAPNTVEELDNLIHSELDPFDKIELVGTLIALQIIRLMCLQATQTIEGNDSQEWLIDLSSDSGGAVRKLAVNSYRNLEENVYRAVHNAKIDDYLEKNVKMTETKALDAAAKDTNLLVRRLAKSIGLLIPAKGANMRFNLNEDLVKVLVLSLIKPGQRMLFSSFLMKCYEHFKIVIGTRELLQHFSDTEIAHSVDFDANEERFQELLRSCGFLRNLSDATSIVENPFKE